MREMGGAEMLRKAVEKGLDAKEKNEREPSRLCAVGQCSPLEKQSL